MNTKARPWIVFPIAILATVIINALLFAGLPLLTRISERERSTEFEAPIMIAHIKPPKPPEERKERVLKERTFKKMDKQNAKKSNARPKMNVNEFEFATDMGDGGIKLKIGKMGQVQEFKSEVQKFEFELSEVDSHPKVVRKAPPVYPFAAKRKGIRGRVMIRCLIAIDGKARKFEIIESIPEGVFDDASISAVQKWRFKPGILGGEPVPTWVRIPFKFSLN